MQRYILLILGVQGSGKSTLIRRLLPEMATRRPVFILDTLGEYNRGLQFQSAAQLRAFLIQRRENPYNIYVLNCATDNDAAEFFELFVTLGEAARQSGRHAPASIVVDEVDKFAPSRGKMDPNLNNIIQYGRHYRQNLILAARRANDVDAKIRAQATAVVSFHQSSSTDVRKLQERFDGADELRRLDYLNHEYAAFGYWQNLPVADALRTDKLRRL